MDNIAVRCTSLAFDHRNIGIFQHDQAVMYRHFNPYGQKIHLSQFPEQSHRVNSHRRQPRAQQLNPACTAAAPGDDDPSALAVDADAKLTQSADLL